MGTLRISSQPTETESLVSYDAVIHHDVDFAQATAHVSYHLAESGPGDRAIGEALIKWVGHGNSPIDPLTFVRLSVPSDTWIDTYEWVDGPESDLPSS